MNGGCHSPADRQRAPRTASGDWSSFSPRRLRWLPLLHCTRPVRARTGSQDNKTRAAHSSPTRSATTPLPLRLEALEVESLRIQSSALTSRTAVCGCLYGQPFPLPLLLLTGPALPQAGHGRSTSCVRLHRRPSTCARRVERGWERSDAC
jgi:hypothetical protein